MRLQHVSIPRPANSGPATRAFYGDLLGLAEKPVPASVAHLDLIWYRVGEGDLELHLFAAEPWTDTTNRHFCLVVDDLDGMWRRLEAAGFEPWRPESIPGRPRFFCRDPFENVVEFTTIEADYLNFQDTPGDD